MQRCVQKIKMLQVKSTQFYMNRNEAEFLRITTRSRREPGRFHGTPSIRTGNAPRLWQFIF